MNWIESLYRTYQNNSENVGNEDDRIPLAPLGHTIQNTQIEITLNQDGEFLDAKADPLITIIPCTETSAGRTNAPVAHPLSDKLKYIASDFFTLTGEKRPKASKNKDLKDHHSSYLSALGAWVSSRHGDKKLESILRYLSNNDGAVLRDLCSVGIYSTSDEGLIHKSWKGEKEAKPRIYEILKNSPAPWDAFVRWRIAIPECLEDRTYFDKVLWEKWISYYLETPSTEGLCYALGGNATHRLATSHPKRIRNVADGAKLISSNDSSGFTFRGRFTDPEGSQVCGVSFEASQKAHSALRWLIARQGKQFGDQQAIVAWATTGDQIPDALASTPDLFDDEELLNAGLVLSETPSLSANTGQAVALALKKKVSGYLATLGDTTDIVILSLDSATPGRMAISYYRELKSSEYLERLEKWHTETAWIQNFGANKKFVGAPSPLDIAHCAYGRRIDDKLKSATYRRLLPCIVENRPIPSDLVTCCVRRASSRQGIDHWEWEKALGIACALYKKQQIQPNNHHHTMSLDRKRTTRSYLYGRLLAVADLLEEATYQKDERRSTHAARSMQVFAERPFKTWTNIETALVPYKRTLATNKPGLFKYFDDEILEIMNSFSPDHFVSEERLNGEFLLAYHSQRVALRLGKKAKEKEQEQVSA